jgi:hypothetical protein
LRQRRHDLLAIFGALLLEHIPADAMADLLIEHGEGGTEGPGGGLARLLDQGTNLFEEFTQFHAGLKVPGFRHAAS